MTELRPCPFCGAPAELVHSKTWDYFVRCTDKGCAARTRQYHENETGAVNAWNARADSYTREECEAAFVRGYSLGSLPVGSDPRWDENRQSVDEHMAELGWVRERTCTMVTDDSCQNWMSCSECDADYYTDQPINYCPNCGAKVRGDAE